MPIFPGLSRPAAVPLSAQFARTWGSQRQTMSDMEKVVKKHIKWGHNQQRCGSNMWIQWGLN
jgi:hypothetical protein